MGSTDFSKPMNCLRWFFAACNVAFLVRTSHSAIYALLNKNSAWLIDVVYRYASGRPNNLLQLYDYNYLKIQWGIISSSEWTEKLAFAITSCMRSVMPGFTLVYMYKTCNNNNDNYIKGGRGVGDSGYSQCSLLCIWKSEDYACWRCGTIASNCCCFVLVFRCRNCPALYYT